MSVTYRATVVAGFELTRRTVMVDRTKYNTNTGEPYTAQEESHEEAIVDSVVVATDQEREGFFQGEMIDGLEIHESGYEEGTQILGAVLASCSENTHDCTDFETEIPEKVMKFAAEHGVTPKLFLLQSCG